MEGADAESAGAGLHGDVLVGHVCDMVLAELLVEEAFLQESPEQMVAGWQPVPQLPLLAAAGQDAEGRASEAHGQQQQQHMQAESAMENGHTAALAEVRGDREEAAALSSGTDIAQPTFTLMEVTSHEPDPEPKTPPPLQPSVGDTNVHAQQDVLCAAPSPASRNVSKIPQPPAGPSSAPARAKGHSRIPSVQHSHAQGVMPSSLVGSGRSGKSAASHRPAPERQPWGRLPAKPRKPKKVHYGSVKFAKEARRGGGQADGSLVGNQGAATLPKVKRHRPAPAKSQMLHKTVNPNAKAVRKSMLTYAAQQHERNKELTLKRRRRAQARAALFGDEMPAELPEDQQLEAPRRLTHVAAGGQPGQEEQGEEEGQGEGQGEGQVGPRPSQPQQPPVMAPPGDLGAHWPLPGACPENVTEVDGMKLGVGVDGERLTTPPAWVSEQGLVEELEELELARQALSAASSGTAAADGMDRAAAAAALADVEQRVATRLRLATELEARLKQATSAVEEEAYEVYNKAEAYGLAAVSEAERDPLPGDYPEEPDTLEQSYRQGGNAAAWGSEGVSSAGAAALHTVGDELDILPDGMVSIIAERALHMPLTGSASQSLAVAQGAGPGAGRGAGQGAGASPSAHPVHWDPETAALLEQRTQQAHRLQPVLYEAGMGGTEGLRSGPGPRAGIDGAGVTQESHAAAVRAAGAAGQGGALRQHMRQGARDGETSAAAAGGARLEGMEAADGWAGALLASHTPVRNGPMVAGHSSAAMPSSASTSEEAREGGAVQRAWSSGDAAAAAAQHAERARTIGEQLSRLQRESKLLQDHSVMLQHRARELQREAGMSVTPPSNSAGAAALVPPGAPAPASGAVASILPSIPQVQQQQQQQRRQQQQQQQQQQRQLQQQLPPLASVGKPPSGGAPLRPAVKLVPNRPQPLIIPPSTAGPQIAAPDTGLATAQPTAVTSIPAESKIHWGIPSHASSSPFGSNAPPSGWGMPLPPTHASSASKVAQSRSTSNRGLRDRQYSAASTADVQLPRWSDMVSSPLASPAVPIMPLSASAATRHQQQPHPGKLRNPQAWGPAGAAVSAMGASAQQLLHAGEGGAWPSAPASEQAGGAARQHQYHVHTFTASGNASSLPPQPHPGRQLPGASSDEEPRSEAKTPLVSFSAPAPPRRKYLPALNFSVKAPPPPPPPPPAPPAPPPRPTPMLQPLPLPVSASHYAAMRQAFGGSLLGRPFMAPGFAMGSAGMPMMSALPWRPMGSGGNFSAFVPHAPYGLMSGMGSGGFGQGFPIRSLSAGSPGTYTYAASAGGHTYMPPHHVHWAPEQQGGDAGYPAGSPYGAWMLQPQQQEAFHHGAGQQYSPTTGGYGVGQPDPHSGYGSAGGSGNEWSQTPDHDRLRPSSEATTPRRSNAEGAKRVPAPRHSAAGPGGQPRGRGSGAKQRRMGSEQGSEETQPRFKLF